ncbi:MAG: ABC transporter substrate-binding protein, partial [bacterium]
RRGVWRRAMSIRGTTFIVVLVVLLAVAFLVLPPPGAAQQAASYPRVGVLAPASLSDPRVPPYIRAFQEGLRELGYVEGPNIAFEFRWAEGQYERLPGFAAELVRLKVNIIVAAGPSAIQAAKQATATIVMAAVADPVAPGFVASLARPGGNITGISNMLPDLVGKQLELLKEVLLTVSRVALLGNPANPANASLERQGQEAARTLGVRLQPLWARDPREIDSAFPTTQMERADAFIVLTDTMLLNHRTRIADHAGRRRLPTVFGVSQFVEAGGLLAYAGSASGKSGGSW